MYACVGISGGCNEYAAQMCAAQMRVPALKPEDDTTLEYCVLDGYFFYVNVSVSGALLW